MPRIIVMADEADERITHSERVSPEDFETEHFRQQLAERVAWAVQDAVQDDTDGGPQPTSFLSQGTTVFR